jgi:hypothetical protein
MVAISTTVVPEVSQFSELLYTITGTLITLSIKAMVELVKEWVNLGIVGKIVLPVLWLLLVALIFLVGYTAYSHAI